MAPKLEDETPTAQGAAAAAAAASSNTKVHHDASKWLDRMDRTGLNGVLTVSLRDSSKPATKPYPGGVTFLTECKPCLCAGIAVLGQRMILQGIAQLFASRRPKASLLGAKDSWEGPMAGPN